jgi:serine/threonine protein kinase/tetratricopeptide (TPR) repeat protein
MPERIGRYQITRKLGEGGMGVVYEARDESLDRAVALKLIREDIADEQATRRFRREAKTAASVSHPNVCQLFEIGEEGGALFIVMELLQGEPLADRIGRGPLPLTEAAPIALGVLSALTALHGGEIVHRDLKPSNVFLTPHGVKLLDFGLARTQKPQPAGGEQTMSQLTQAGLLVGTPRYMAPEQVRAQAVDARTDLFAMGAILFEMLTGRPPFRGNDMVEILYAIAHEQPPALTGSAAIEAVDRVVRRALAKRPDDRYAAAAAMSQDLREALLLESSSGTAPVRTMTRLIALPFRCLRADADTDFLAFSLPDAITAALSGLGSLIVRSSLAAAKFADVSDLKRIASEADVDAVLTGTILRAGEQLRVSTQLVEAPAGTLIWSHTTQATLVDIFQVQDDLVRRIVDSLSTPLTAREHKRLKQQLPATARAYELYLRANQLSLDPNHWETARDLYERAVEEDAQYAPAWARLGRVYRLLSKYGMPGPEDLLGKAESAFRRALSIDPDLPLAHNLFAQLEVEAGRPRDVLLRLLERTRAFGHDADLFAALVHVTRYCGLLDASLAAHRRVRSLDPNVPTSVAYTHWMGGDYQQASEAGRDDLSFMVVYSAIAAGRTAEAVAIIEKTAPQLRPHTREFALAYQDALLGRREEAMRRTDWIMDSGFRDPEGIYFVARVAAYVQDAERALRLFERVIDGGFFCFPAFVRDPWLDNLRMDPRFRELMRRAEERRREAEVAFIQAGGERLLA